MIEAQIICCARCTIQDLDLDLMPGQELWVADEVAQNSRDLQREQRKGNVRVYRKTRRMAREPKLPPPPFVARSRPQVREREEPKVIERVVERVVEKVVEKQTDMEEVARRVKADLVGDLREIIAQEMARLLPTQAAPQEAPAPAQSLDAETLEKALEAVLGRLMAGGGFPARRESKVEPETPLYVPGNLVDKDAKARIAVREQAQEDGGSDLDAAASALKRFKKLRAGTNDGNEES